MKKSELNSDPDLSIPILPVICEQCRAAGMAGDEKFAGIPDILDFEPVPRRARADGWKPEHQRAFIAALAITGSPRQAARTIGKHEFGAQGLRQARGGRGFAAAWDAAMDIARDREFARIHGNLKELADQAANAEPVFTAEGAEDETAAAGGYDDAEIEAMRERILNKVRRLEDRTLRDLCDTPEKRAAWELLHGPREWGENGASPPPAESESTERSEPPSSAPSLLGEGDHLKDGGGVPSP